MTKHTPGPTIQQIADSLTSEEYIKLLQIAHPLSPEERAKLDKLSDDELLAELMK